MFAKDKVSQSLIDAVNKVITKEEVKEQLNEAFPTVADAQKRANEPKPSGGSGIKLGTRYGGGRQADEPEDDEGEKKPAKREKYGARKTRFTNTKLYKEDEVQEELKGNQHKIDANKNGKIDAHDFQLLRGKKKKVAEENTFADRLIESMYGKKSALPLDEKEMSDAQKKKKEEIVMSMKKDTEGLKKRYGSRWKDVMYATATKQAMKEAHDEEVEIEEEIDPKVRTKDSLSGGNKPTNQKDDTGPGSDGRSTKVKFKAGPMDEEKENEKEDEGHEDEAEDKKLVKKMVKKDALKEEELDEAAKKKAPYDRDEVAKKIGAAMNKADDAVRKGRAEREAARAIATAKYGSKMKKEDVELDEEQLDEISKKTVKSYLSKTVDPIEGMPRPGMGKRMKGIAAAHQRLVGKKPTSEEVGLDETSHMNKPKSLKSFMAMKKEMIGKAGMTSEKKDED